MAQLRADLESAAQHVASARAAEARHGGGVRREHARDAGWHVEEKSAALAAAAKARRSRRHPPLTRRAQLEHKLATGTTVAAKLEQQKLRLEATRAPWRPRRASSRRPPRMSARLEGSRRSSPREGTGARGVRRRGARHAAGRRAPSSRKPPPRAPRAPSRGCAAKARGGGRRRAMDARRDRHPAAAAADALRTSARCHEERALAAMAEEHAASVAAAVADREAVPRIGWRLSRRGTPPSSKAGANGGCPARGCRAGY